MRLTLLLSFLAMCRALSAADLKVGAAAEKITPPLGIPMAGYYHARGAQSVHDDLYAKAIVLNLQDTSVALVSLDLISTTHSLVEQARQKIQDECQIPADNVMISATHTHTGPVLHDPNLHDDALVDDSDLSMQYTRQLPAMIAAAVRRAQTCMKPARAMATAGFEDSIAFNRRYHMTDGSVAWNPGKLNPKILKPAGPIDPQVSIVMFQSMGDRPIAAYVNYAVHLDNVGGAEISADLPATVSRLLSEALDPDLLTLYTTGCCGDINHIDVNWRQRQHGHENATRMGIILAGAVLRALPRLQEIPAEFLVCRRQGLDLPLPSISEADVRRASATIERARSGKKDQAPAFLEQVEAFKILDVAARKGRPHRTEVQVVALGRSLAFVALPGEVFAELGLAIKQDSPFPRTIIAELANGSVGYIPSRRAYPQGAYEVVSTRCAEGSGEMLVQAAVDMLKSIYADPAPAGPGQQAGRP